MRCSLRGPSSSLSLASTRPLASTQPLASTRPTPVWLLGMLLFCGVAFAGTPGDIDGDTDIDADDIAIILASRNLPASGPGDPLDLDGDGLISVLDARIAATLCTRPLCAPGNNAPTITAPADLSQFEDTSSGPLPIVVGDPDIGFDPDLLVVTASSSDQGLIPDANLTLGGAGAARTILVEPAVDGNGGPVTVTLVVDDGVDTAMDSFTVLVDPVNDAPTLDAIADPAAIFEEAAQQTVAFSGVSAGPPDEIQVLAVTASSSNPGLIPDPIVTYSSADATGSLAYTPLADQFGSATITVTVMDDGGVLNGGVDSFVRVFDVTVIPINDAPTLDPVADPAPITENDPEQTVSFMGVSAGPNETQVLSVTATSDNPGLIPDPTVTYTSPNGAGTLMYTPILSQTGMAVVTVTVMDDGGTANGGVDTTTQMFTVTVDPQNVAPQIVSPSTANAAENQTAVLDVDSTDDLDGEGSGLDYSLTGGDDQAAFSIVPATGVLSFNSAPDFELPGSFDGDNIYLVQVTVTDSGPGPPLTAFQDLSITVTEVNDAPTLDAIADPAAILEDAAQQMVALSGIGSGAAAEAQVLSVTATSSSPGLIPHPAVTYASPNATGSLAYTPVANQSGVATITVTVMDDGGTAGGGIDTFVRMFNVAVTEVNDAPTLDGIADPAAITENDPQQTVSFTGVSTGGGETQVLAVSATSSNVGLIPNPSVTYTSPNAGGMLMYTPVASQTGTAVITVTVMDDGGTASGGVNTTDTMFTVTVNPLNTAPTITSAATANAPENQTGVIDVASMDDMDSEGAGLTYSLTGGADILAFTIVPATGVLTFNAAPDFESPGSGDGDNVYLVQVTVTDSGPGTPLTAVQDLAVTVTDVNEAPTADDEVYASTGNVGIAVTMLVNGVLNGDTDPDVGDVLTVTSPTQGVPTGTSMGGSVTVTSANNGTFTYTPPAGLEGVADTFMYTVSDGSLSDTGTVTINLSDMIWFIDNTMGGIGGAGTLSNPFRRIQDFTGSGAPAAGEGIYLEHTGTNYTAGLTLTNNQRLIGEGATGTLHGHLGITLPSFSMPLPALGAGTNPMITTTGSAGITLASGNTIRGVDIGNTAGGLGVTGTNFGTATIDDVAVSGTGEGVNFVTGNLAATFTSISSSAATAVPGINLSGTTGSFSVVGDGTSGGVLGMGNNGSGGSITNKTGNAIRLAEADGVTLRQMNIGQAGALGNIDGSGVRASGVNGLVIANSTFRNVADQNSPDEAALFVTSPDAGSDITLTNNVFNRSWDDHVRIENGNAAGTPGAALGTIAVSQCDFDDNDASNFGSDAILYSGDNGSNSTINITSNRFHNSDGDHIQIGLNGTASSTVAIGGPMPADGNTMSSAGSVLGSGITLSSGQGAGATNFSGLLNYTIQNNTINDATSTSINVNLSSSSTSGNRYTGLIDNNLIGTAGLNESAGFGIALTVNGSGTLNSTITNNVVREHDGDHALSLVTRDGNGRLNATVRDNTFTNSTNTTGFDVIGLGAGAVGGDMTTLCADIDNNTFAGQAPAGGFDFALAELAGTNTIILPGYAGGATDTGAAVTHIQGNNVGVPTGFGFITAPGSILGTGATCP